VLKQSVTKQTTLGNPVSCAGVGLHTGSQVTMTLRPARANTGIIFRRTDIEGDAAYVPASFDTVTETRLGTTIRNRFGVSVATVEHLMAALWGAGIDNAVIELSGPEVPIMDGSSEPFIFMLECARVVTMPAARRTLRIVKPVEVRDGESFARVIPNTEGEEGCVLDIEIEFNNTVISRQIASYDFRDVSFKQAISRARTFGFEHEVAALRKMGLALGGSLDNAVVVGEKGILNKEGLRYSDEFVRHKALDCLGDLYLCGYRIDGRFTFVRPGHAINNQLLRAIFADESAYLITESGRIAPVLPAPREGATLYA
jgi:UDP-3-O-[3-hydroxymyristoyl] N-acetylglucosamine deacetylase